ncbi:MAG: hypothetical protein LBT53_02360 [Puniceicoccales bacterium]|nr:hypothetical protein [Puniceicoccales bacterium]
MPPPSIHCKNATFGYPGREVLRGVNLALPAGALGPIAATAATEATAPATHP